MAKRKAQHMNAGPEYDEVEPEVVEEMASEPEAVITKPGGPVAAPDVPFYTPDPNEPHMVVTFTLPRNVLVALLDAAHSLADGYGAEHYGLLADGELTPIGEKVLNGFDQTAVRHRMLAAWREQHNREVGGV